MPCRDIIKIAHAVEGSTYTMHRGKDYFYKLLPNHPFYLVINKTTSLNKEAHDSERRHKIINHLKQAKIKKRKKKRNH